jgi:hypothetical protein
MTNEETIALLKQMQISLARGTGKVLQAEALGLAISALEHESKGIWIPIKAHPATNEERENRPDIVYWFDCEMPDDGQEILVTVNHRNWISVEKDVCCADSDYSLDSGYDWLNDIIAWMPLPEPYKGE